MKVNSSNGAAYFDEDNNLERLKVNEILSKYIKYWPFVLLSVLIGLFVAYLKNQYTPPIYKIESKFLIKDEDKSLNILDLTGLAGTSMANQGQKLANESILLKSKPMAEQVLNHLDFDVEYYTEGPFIYEEIYQIRPVVVDVDWGHTQLTEGFIKLTWVDKEKYEVELLDEEYTLIRPDSEINEMVENVVFSTNSFAFGEWVETGFAKFKVDWLGDTENGQIFLKFRGIKSLVSQFTGDDLQVFPLDATSSILGLSLITNQPEKGQLYLNTLMEVFLDNELKDKTLIASNTVNFIDSQISGVADSLNFTGNDLQVYRSSNKTYNIGAEGNTIFIQLSELEKTLSEEKFKQDYYSKLQDYLVREEYNEIIMPSGLGIDDPILNTLIENLITLQAEKSRHLATQTEASPTVKEVNRKITDLNASIKEVLRNVISNAAYAIDDLGKRIAKIEGEFSRLPTTEQNLLRFQRKFELNENIYTFLLQRRAEAAIAMASNTASNKVVEYAGLNYEAIKVKEMVVLLFALGLALVFPVVVITISTLVDTKIKDAKALEESMVIPLLGKIANSNNHSIVAVFSEPRSVIAENFRSLKTNISYVVPLDKQITIAISSTISGEGKTFMAANLAAIYALNQKRTVLLDCDMFKSSTLDDFKPRSKVGLSNFLSQQTNNFEDLVQTSEYPLFDFITSGVTPPNPSDLLASERFGMLMESLKKTYDVIILDTPPVGLISQVFEVSKHADLILYVFRCGVSQKRFVNEVNGIKVKKGVKNVFGVLNGVAEKEFRYRGGYYGYYEETPNKSSKIKEFFLRNKSAL